MITERRAAGLPVWQYTVRGFRAILEADIDLPEKRDKLAALLKRSKWYKEADEYGDLWDAVDELSDMDLDEYNDYDPERHFNEILTQIYDLADWDRAWLE